MSSNETPRWWHCDTHGPATASAWGCPECVREMRDKIQRLQRELGECTGALECAGQPIEWQAKIDAAVSAERERCASIVETQDTYGDSVGCWFETLAAKIRA